MKRLEALALTGGNFNIADKEKFDLSIRMLKDSLSDKGATLFVSDNMILWGKIYSFVRDDYYREFLTSDDVSLVEKSIIWRTYILLYFAEIASHLEGDFAEFGCLKGSTAYHVIQKLNFAQLNKRFFLYDLFEWKEGDTHSRLPELDNPNLYKEVQERFSMFKFVTIIKGSVPQSFERGFPDRIAFAHIDMNSPDPEVAALEAVLPKLVIGGVVILDDYGWWWYSAQKVALDPIIKKYGLKVLELPTGQGLIIK